MKLAASPARKTTAAASSSGRPCRPSGRFRMLAAVNSVGSTPSLSAWCRFSSTMRSVSKRPVRIEFNRTSGAASFARAFPIATTAGRRSQRVGEHEVVDRLMRGDRGEVDDRASAAPKRREGGARKANGAHQYQVDGLGPRLVVELGNA